MDAAIAIGFDKFLFRRKGAPHTLEQADTARVEIAITYQGRSFQTLDVDLGMIGELYDLINPVIYGLSELGLPVTSPIRCLTLPVQIAQKIHAATNPRIINDPKQNRARDILDVLLIKLLGQFDEDSIRKAVVRIFKERAEHAWPPQHIIYPGDWKARLADMATTLGYPITDAEEILANFHEIIGKLVV